MAENAPLMKIAQNTIPCMINIFPAHVKTETMLVELREREEKLYRDALADTKLCLDIKNSLATYVSNL